MILNVNYPRAFLMVTMLPLEFLPIWSGTGQGDSRTSKKGAKKDQQLTFEPTRQQFALTPTCFIRQLFSKQVTLGHVSPPLYDMYCGGASNQPEQNSKQSLRLIENGPNGKRNCIQKETQN